MLKIVVVDGQGGGIGSLIVKKVRDLFNESVEVIALGTNAAATSAMLKARANRGATGENAIVLNAGRCDLIVGPLSIVVANSMMGELTPEMAEAIGTSQARKILLPLNQEGIDVVGASKEPLPHMVDSMIALIEKIKDLMEVR
ncbi:MAG: DUF3842 family protein [Nitrospirae bacterium]|nr:DUF3842 family protein [Nitrospirota bacterium]